MAISYISARFSATDSNGRPLVGGKLYTYQNGSTTPAATYQDKAQTTANTNPVILDSRGEAVLWLVPGQLYRFVLQDRFGSLIWSQDDIDGAVSQFSLSQAGGAALVGFKLLETGAVVRTVQDKSRESASPEDFGALGDGSHDDTAAMQQAVNAAKRVWLTRGAQYKLTSSIATPSDTEILNNGATILWYGPDATAETGVFASTSATDIKFRYPVMVNMSANDSLCFYRGAGVRGLKLDTPSTINASICEITSETNDYASSVTDPSSGGFNCSSDVNITNFTALGRGADKHRAACLILYTVGWSITGGNARNILHGVQFWGGDANPAGNGDTANERKLKRGSVSNVTTYNTYAGVWGSMGQDVTVTGCTIEKCGDVGIDFEGCFDCTATGNAVRHAINGCLAGFWLSRNVSFVGNVCYQDGSNGSLLWAIKNATGAAVPGYSMTSNTFRFGGASGIGLGAKDPTGSFVYKGNIHENVIIGKTGFLNQGRESYCGNEFLLTLVIPSAAAVMDLGGNTINLQAIPINDNVIGTTVAQLGNTVGIRVAQIDGNNNVVTHIKRNSVHGFASSIANLGESSNAGVQMRYVIEDNQIDGGIVDASPATRVKRSVKGNRDLASLPLPILAPVPYGHYSAGDQLYTPTPAASTSMGLMCIHTGFYGPAFRPTASYILDEILWTDTTGSTLTYRVIQAGTSAASAPTGTGDVANGSVIFRAIGDSALFKAMPALAA